MPNKEETLKVIRVVPGTSVDGPGLRTSIYFSGCTHHCPGCHNPQSWPLEAGEEVTLTELIDEIELHGFNITLTGGDPMMQAKGIIPFVREAKRRGYTIWCYTGYSFEEITQNQDEKYQLLQEVDVVVDGRYEHSLRNIHLRFRGSENQRIIDVQRSLALNRIELWSD